MGTTGSFTVVAAPIQTGLHRIVQKSARKVSDYIVQKQVHQIYSLNVYCVVVAPATYSTIFPCLSGVYTKEFCCSDTGGKSCCDANANAIFSFDPGKPYALLSTLVSDVQDNTSTSKLSTSSSSSGLSSTSTSPGTQIVWSTTTSTNPAVCNTSAPLPIPSSRNFTAIVLGVGVPPSLLLLLSLGFFFYRERHLRTMMESLKRKTKAAMRPHGLYPLVPNTGDLPHLEYTYRAPVELDSRSRWVYGAATRFELETGSLETGSNHS